MASHQLCSKKRIGWFLRLRPTPIGSPLSSRQVVLMTWWGPSIFTIFPRKKVGGFRDTMAWAVASIGLFGLSRHMSVRYCAKIRRGVWSVLASAKREPPLIIRTTRIVTTVTPPQGISAGGCTTVYRLVIRVWPDSAVGFIYESNSIFIKSA